MFFLVGVVGLLGLFQVLALFANERRLLADYQHRRLLTAGHGVTVVSSLLGLELVVLLLSSSSNAKAIIASLKQRSKARRQHFKGG